MKWAVENEQPQLIRGILRIYVFQPIVGVGIGWSLS